MTDVPIRVVIVDDHELVRIGISQFLSGQANIEVVGTAGDGESAVRLAGELQPAVVLMDLAMPGVDGVEATRRLQETAPSARVIVLTSFSDRSRILDALDAGAVGYLLKDAEPAELIRGVEAAARGESPLSPKVANALLEERRVREAGRQLTPREREVLVLLARGLLNKQIARELGISEKTVKAHLVNVFDRIGVSDRTQAALWAERRGLVR
ncbi:MAG: response regulator transcription factor [Dehalococcoidia bacterium]|nr:response regulator transcription factor [Dehalococcoidia bacterium]HRC63028.1 response regulator transcription factor [Dehalococcoidia bacterium]